MKDHAEGDEDEHGEQRRGEGKDIASRPQGERLSEVDIARFISGRRGRPGTAQQSQRVVESCVAPHIAAQSDHVIMRGRQLLNVTWLSTRV